MVVAAALVVAIEAESAATPAPEQSRERAPAAFYKLQAHFLLKEQQFNSAAQYPPEGRESSSLLNCGYSNYTVYPRDMDYIYY